MANRPVDEKIVVMKLDNSEFAKKATETTSLFGKLTNALNKIPGINIGKTAKDMSTINDNTMDTANNMNKLVGVANNVAGRFTNLGIVGVTALQNISNRAIDAGINMAKSLTIDPVTQGFQEYETKIGAIGTMLANTEWYGATLDDVKATLEELNVYADNTVYSFSQMTENIGRFTAAGVKLDDASIAIKGMSNLAAASGSDVNQLNTAMYQMSQAMAAGKMNLMDWNSLVNAGMAGKKTQDALVETAKAMGKTIDLTDGFRNSIQQGWLTSDVFLETMKKFGSDPAMTEAATAVRTFTGMMDSLKETVGSSWATTWELIFGDFEEATTFWTAISNSLGGFINKFGTWRNELLKGAKDAGAMKNIFEGIGNVVSNVGKITTTIGDAFSRVFPPLTVERIVKMTESFKALTSGMSVSYDSLGNLYVIFQGFFGFVSGILLLIKQLGGALLNLIPDGVGGSLMELVMNFAQLGTKFNESVKSGNFLTDFIDKLAETLGGLGEIVGNTVASLAGLGGSAFEGLGGALDWISDKLKNFMEIFNSQSGSIGADEVLGAGTLFAVFTLIDRLKGIIDNVFGPRGGFGDIVESFSDTAESLSDSLNAFTVGVKIVNLVLIAGAVTMLAMSLKTLEGINTEDLTKGITALAISLGVMLAAVAVIGKFNLTGGLSASVTILALAAAVNIIADSLNTLSGINPERLNDSLSALITVFLGLSGAIYLLSKTDGTVGVGSLQLVALAVSVKILVGALEDMSKIQTNDLIKSIGALAGVFLTLAGFMALTKKSTINPLTAASIFIISGAVKMMASSVKTLGSLDLETLAKGLGSIAALLGTIALFSKFAGGPQIILAGTGMVILATAINVMIPAIEKIGGMDLPTLAQGIIGLGLAMTAVAAAGLIANGALVGSMAMAVMAASIQLLVPAIKTIGEMSMGEVTLGISGLALGLAALAATSLLLTPAVIPMLGFSAAVGILGLAILAAGVGVGAFGAGLASLAGLTAASVAAIVSALGILIVGLTDLIVDIVKFVVTLGKELLSGISELGPMVIDTIAELVLAILTTLTEHLPEILEKAFELVVQLAEGIGKGAPMLVDAGVELIIDLINGLADAIKNNGPMLTDSILGLIGEIIILVVDAGSQVINALFGWIPGVSEATASLGQTAEDYIRANFGAAEVGEEKGIEFSGALAGMSDAAGTAGTALAEAGQGGASSVSLTTTGTQFGQGFINGMGSSSVLSSIWNTAKGLASKALSAVKSTLNIQSPSREAYILGEYFGDGLSNGIGSKKEQVARTSEEIAEAALSSFREAISATDEEYEMGILDYNGYLYELGRIRDASLNNSKALYEANKKIREVQMRNSKDWIEDELYYKRLSLDQELAAWERVQARYAAGTEERKEADREVFRLKNELQEESFNHSKKWIDNEKHYNRLSLKDELAAWQRVQARYAKGTTQRIEADKEVYRLKNEINQKLNALNEDFVNKSKDLNDKLVDDIKRVQREFDDMVSSRADSIAGFAGIFDEINNESKKDITGDKLLSNLRGQVETFANWSNNIEILSSKNIDPELLTTLREMGPAAAVEIAALNTLSEQELSDYSNLWKTKNAMAKHEALIQLEGQKQQTAETIEQMTADTAAQLEEYKQEWVKAVAEIKDGVSDQYVELETEMTDIGGGIVDGLINGMKDMIPELRSQAADIAKTISETINKTLDISTNFMDSITSNFDLTNMDSKQSLNSFLNGYMAPSAQTVDSGVMSYTSMDRELPTAVDTSVTWANLAKLTNSASGTKSGDKEVVVVSQNGDMDKIATSIDNLASQPVVTKVYLDGNEIADVVSVRQSSEASITAITKGVVFD